jgi:hypothetical protein
MYLRVSVHNRLHAHVFMQACMAGTYIGKQTSARVRIIGTFLDRSSTVISRQMDDFIAVWLSVERAWNAEAVEGQKSGQMSVWV